MKSVYAKILLWCFATVVFSLFAFWMVSRFVETRAFGKGGPMARVDQMVLHEAAQAYESGGTRQLAAYLDRISAFLDGPRYLTDSRGRDLVTGADRSEQLQRVRNSWAVPVPEKDHMIVGHTIPENGYVLITVLNPLFPRWALAPFYALILAAVGLVCWALAVSIASPLRDLARGVDRFGRGELSVRLNSRRRDEIGELARSFDHMAERIGALLTAERRLLQDVSHELRSPLARMSFAAELARRDENREQAIAQMKAEIQRLSDLIATLLQVTRSEGDPMAIKREEFSIADLLREIAADCRIEADTRGCRVRIDAYSGPVIVGDRQLGRRAFENIVRNAILYSPEGSPIDISVHVNSTSVCVVVRDYGMGVPEHLLDRLGQPFFRVDDSRDSSTGGVGLGLAIAKRAIAIHHGSLRLENAHPGLSVSVELPLPEMQAGALKAGAGPARPMEPPNGSPLPAAPGSVVPASSSEIPSHGDLLAAADRG